MHPVVEFLIKLVIAAVIAIVIGLLDGPLIIQHADDW